jgi:hypothetical protein
MSTQNIFEPNRSPNNCSVSYADIPNQMVRNGVDTIIQRITPAYMKLLEEARQNPSIISDYRSSLFDYYKGMTLTPEIRETVMQAQEMAPDYDVVRKEVSHEERFSVFFGKTDQSRLNQAPDDARLHIKLKVDPKHLKEADPLDQMLLQLFRKIVSEGYGDTGLFDIRLEKGILSLESDPWKWHYDGEVFKTSVTVCYSNKINWSTRIADGRPSDHGFLYDAKKIYHRAPIPSDLDDKQLDVSDIRLFIRYNEFFTKSERAHLHRDAEEVEGINRRSFTQTVRTTSSFLFNEELFGKNQRELSIFARTVPTNPLLPESFSKADPTLFGKLQLISDIDFNVPMPSLQIQHLIPATAQMSTSDSSAAEKTETKTSQCAVM